jgi:hypothetical protein
MAGGKNVEMRWSKNFMKLKDLLWFPDAQNHCNFILLQTIS